MPIYEIANPSDPVTIEAESDADAALAVLVLEPGGSYGCRSADSEGRMVLPVLRFWSEPAAEEWLSENPAVTADQQTPERRRRIASVLESAAVCSISDRLAMKAAIGDDPTVVQRWNESKRSSMNNICGRARQLAARLRELAGAPAEVAGG